MTEYKDNWREIAKASEKDPKVMDILENGPRSLTQAWLLQAMKYKYGRTLPPFPFIMTSVETNKCLARG